MQVYVFVLFVLTGIFSHDEPLDMHTRSAGLLPLHALWSHALLFVVLLGDFFPVGGQDSATRGLLVAMQQQHVSHAMAM